MGFWQNFTGALLGEGDTWTQDPGYPEAANILSNELLYERRPGKEERGFRHIWKDIFKRGQSEKYSNRASLAQQLGNIDVSTFGDAYTDPALVDAQRRRLKAETEQSWQIAENDRIQNLGLGAMSGAAGQYNQRRGRAVGLAGQWANAAQNQYRYKQGRPGALAQAGSAYIAGMFG